MNNNALPETGYLRLSQIIGRKENSTDKNGNKKRYPQEAIPALIPVCKTTWWQGIRDGRYPPAIKLSERVTAWRVEDIRAFIQKTNSGISGSPDTS